MKLGPPHADPQTSSERIDNAIWGFEMMLLSLAVGGILIIVLGIAALALR